MFHHSNISKTELFSSLGSFSVLRLFSALRHRVGWAIRVLCLAQGLSNSECPRSAERALFEVRLGVCVGATASSLMFAISRITFRRQFNDYAATRVNESKEWVRTRVWKSIITYQGNTPNQPTGGGLKPTNQDDFISPYQYHLPSSVLVNGCGPTTKWWGTTATRYYSTQVSSKPKLWLAVSRTYPAPVYVHLKSNPNLNFGLWKWAVSVCILVCISFHLKSNLNLNLAVSIILSCFIFHLKSHPNLNFGQQWEFSYPTSVSISSLISI